MLARRRIALAFMLPLIMVAHADHGRPIRRSRFSSTPYPAHPPRMISSVTSKIETVALKFSQITFAAFTHKPRKCDVRMHD
jgi:hypothetical protein